LKGKVDKEGCTTFSKLLNKDSELQNLVDNYFIPLLFLSQEQKVNIWQDDFFSEIFIKII
jgi:chromatin segregation and condensation protein Rec8/ScpA/Scc1 (kleisin family)